MPDSQRKPFDRQALLLFCAAGLLLAWHLPTLWRDLHSLNDDYVFCYVPWYQYILNHGRLRSLGGGFTNYNPPYVYLMCMVSVLRRLAGPVVLIRMINLPFMLLAGWMTFDICRELKVCRERAAAVAVLLAVSPEVWGNSLVWGQCDIVYTSFMLAFYRLMLAKRPNAALALFGTALAFKLQAIFAGPLLLALWLTGEFSFWQFAIIPATYVMWMIPARLSGRHWRDLFSVYSGQYDAPGLLGMHVPNPFFMIQQWIPDARDNMASRVGILIAAAASLLLVMAFVRRPKMQNPFGWLTMMMVCFLMEPYLLPKMHDRYFFVGDTVALILVAVRPGVATAAMAILLQATAFITYRQFLLNEPRTPESMVIPLILVTSGLVLALRQFWLEGGVEPVPSATELSAAPG